MPTAALRASEGPRPQRRYAPPSDAVERACAELLPGLSELERRAAPERIWLAGDTELARAPFRVSVVGSRRATQDGLRRAAKLSALIAREGGVVVSGLADGVDGVAHRAAIDAGGRTIAVIGTTLGRCYPRAHASLQMEIYADHLLVSQFEPGRPTYPSGFPKRNRLMALLSHASVVIEAGDSSGTLSQAAETVRLGRPLFILRSVLERRDLQWPHRFLGQGALILDDFEQLRSTLVERARREQPVPRTSVEPSPLVLPGCEIS